MSGSPLTREALQDVIDLCLWTGQLLLQYGAETAIVEETMHRLATGLGADWVDILVSHSALVVTTTSGDEFRTKTRRVVRFGGVNMTILASINRLSRQASAGVIDRFRLREQLEVIEAYSKPYPLWLIPLAVGLACAAFARLFGGDLVDMGVTLVAAASAMGVRLLAMRRFLNPYLTTAAAALTAGTVAGYAFSQSWGMHPALPFAASVLLLVPGVPLINSIEDLLKGYVVTGLARGTTGFLVTMSIAAGLALPLGLFGVDRMLTTISRLPTTWEDALWAATAALGFAVLFSVPRQYLIACALTGALGHAFRYALIGSGLPILGGLEIASFFGAAAVGFTAVGLARWLKVPAIIFSVCGIIPMIPGTIAFGAMLGVLQLGNILPPPAGTDLVDLLAAASVNAIKTGLILSALALGISSPTLIFRRSRPVV